MPNTTSRSSKLLKSAQELAQVDEYINEMIKKRNLQQEALLKIMTSIETSDKNDTGRTEEKKPNVKRKIKKP